MPPFARSRLRLVYRIAAGLAVLGGGAAFLFRHRLHRWLKGGDGPAGSVWNERDDKEVRPAIREGDLTVAGSPNLARILAAYQIRLSDSQRESLQADGFVLLPLEGTTLDQTFNRDELLAANDTIGGAAHILLRVPENARLVTPDLVLHAFHRYFSMTQELLERGRLREDLGRFLEGLLAAAAQAGKQAAPGSPEAQGCDRIRAQMAVALSLLETCGPLPPPFFQAPKAEQAYLDQDAAADTFGAARGRLARRIQGLPRETRERSLEELKLIYDARATAPSPLFGDYDPSIRADYTQFAPRSYYRRWSVLRAYFRAMMYLGRNGYALKTDAGIADAALLAGLFSRKGADGEAPAAAWQRVLDLTSLYAGPSDDLTYPEWTAFLKEVGGPEAIGAQAARPELLARVRGSLDRLRPPRILSDPAGDERTARMDPDARLRDARAFRIFGQRFTFDAWILNRLITKDQLPGTALYLPACLGDARAMEHVEAHLRQHPGPGAGPGPRAAIAAVAGDLAREPKAAWETSISAGWLEVLGTLTRPHGAGHPRYMQSEAFRDKQIQTFLGSYAELKHATLLYARQNYGEAGEGGDGPVPAVVKGFVEPNLPFWNAFAALVGRVQRRFEQGGWFPNGEVTERLREFAKDVDFYRRFAIRELRGAPISDDDYESLRVKTLSYMAWPLAVTEEVTPKTGRTALVTDVLTDGRNGTILYEATGRPYLMLALVGNEQSPRAVLGLAYSHYEFTEPLGARLTDEAWRERLYAPAPRLPAKNAWYGSLKVR
jgi:hypothetical protein